MKNVINYKLWPFLGDISSVGISVSQLFACYQENLVTDGEGLSFIIFLFLKFISPMIAQN